jgi:hypothetical protein
LWYLKKVPAGFDSLNACCKRQATGTCPEDNGVKNHGCMIFILKE